MGITAKQKKQINTKRKKRKLSLKEHASLRRSRHLRPKIKLPKEKVAKRKKRRATNILPPARYSEEFKSIVKHFLSPLMSELRAGSYEEKVQIAFGAMFRDVVMAVANVDFNMIGYVWDSTCNDQRPPLLSESKISRGTTLIVRLDERTPDRIDIEIPRTDVVFSLTNDEYSIIYTCIKEVAGCDIRLEPPKKVWAEI